MQQEVGGDRPRTPCFLGIELGSAEGFSGTPCPQGVYYVEISAGRQAAVPQIKRSPRGRWGQNQHTCKHLVLQARTEFVEGVQHL